MIRVLGTGYWALDNARVILVIITGMQLAADRCGHELMALSPSSLTEFRTVQFSCQKPRVIELVSISIIILYIPPLEAPNRASSIWRCPRTH
jgi:hypothetical protein